MATVNPVTNDLLYDNRIFTWPNLAAGDDGAPIGAATTGDRTVQIEGNFGAGGSVQIEGTLDNQNWRTLRDPGGTALVFTSANLKAVMENVLALRPKVTAGDGSTAITVTLAIRRYGNG